MLRMCKRLSLAWLIAAFGRLNLFRFISHYLFSLFLFFFYVFFFVFVFVFVYLYLSVGKSSLMTFCIIITGLWLSCRKLLLLLSSATAHICDKLFRC